VGHGFPVRDQIRDDVLAEIAARAGFDRVASELVGQDTDGEYVDASAMERAW
jgi:predicted DsbA family dithiol-disulfide isomerase